MDDGRPVPLLADVVTALRRDTTARRRLAGGGVLIAFEGGEGVGQVHPGAPAAGVADRARGWSSRATFEPGATPSGAGSARSCSTGRSTGIASPRARRCCTPPTGPSTCTTCSGPALDAGEVVITDRFVDSSLAYQGAGRDDPVDDVRMLSRWATEGLQPDLTVLLDLPPEVGLARARGRAVADRLESESLDFHQRVRQTFRALAEADPDRYLVRRRPPAARRDRRGRSASGWPTCCPACRCSRSPQPVRPHARRPAVRRIVAPHPRPPARPDRLDPPAAPVTGWRRPRASGRRWSASRAVVAELRPRGRRARGDDPRLAVHRPARLGPLGRRARVRRRAAVRRTAAAAATATPAAPCWPAPTPTCTSSCPRGCRSASTRCASSCAARRGAPSQGRWQVMLVEDADRLTEQAANALLKMIEEPPPRTVFLLCAPSCTPTTCSVTIRSRCRVVGAAHPAGRGGRRRAGPPGRRRPGAGRLGGARPAQGHVGRARRLARDEDARLAGARRCSTIPLVADLAGGLPRRRRRPGRRGGGGGRRATAALDGAETEALQMALGAGGTGKGAAAAAARRRPAVKELENRQKSRATRVQRDSLDRALSTWPRSTATCCCASPAPPVALAHRGPRPRTCGVAARVDPPRRAAPIDAVLACREALEQNVKPRIALEAMTVALRCPDASMLRCPGPRTVFGREPYGS